MAGTKRDPFKNYSFLVEIDGIASSAFKSVSGLAAKAEVIEYREGSDPVSSWRKLLLPGSVEYPNVRLSRGLTTSRDLWDWWQTVADGSLERRNVSITLLDDARNPDLRWLLRDAWITKFEAPELDASANEVAIETIELAHERLELDTSRTEDDPHGYAVVKAAPNTPSQSLRACARGWTVFSRQNGGARCGAAPRASSSSPRGASAPARPGTPRRSGGRRARRSAPRRAWRA